MKELIRDTCFGQIVRLVSGNRLLRYPEEDDPDWWKKYVHEEKSGWAAHHGIQNGAVQPHGEESDEEEYQGIGGIRTRENGQTEPIEPGAVGNGNALSSSSSMTRVGNTGSNGQGEKEEENNDTRYNNASGVKVDPEKGRDIHLITFLPDDPEVSLTCS